jgi:cyclophilin family peptidyl-prolyl cis-trans isomerase
MSFLKNLFPFNRGVMPSEVMMTTNDAGKIETERPLAAMEPARRDGYFKQAPPLSIDLAKSYTAVLTTNRGTMRIALFADKAPLTVNNFVYLATQGFYDGTTFHRVIADFMVQGGDPSGSGRGGPGYRFKDEFDPSLTFNKRGLLAMANAGPGTNGSQFFITHVPTPHLNHRHTIFGEIVEGEDVLMAIRVRDPREAAPGDSIERIDIYVG